MNNNHNVVAWVPVREINEQDCGLAADTGIVVRITMKAGFRPQYSMTIGRTFRAENGEVRFVPHLPAFADAQLGKVTLRQVANIVSALAAKAEEWIHEKCQQREDEIIDTRRQREEAHANQGKPVTRHTGKTEKKRLRMKGKFNKDIVNT